MRATDCVPSLLWVGAGAVSEGDEGAALVAVVFAHVMLDGI